MVVWTYDLDSIIPTCRDFEDKLIKLVWNRRAAFSSSLASSAAPSTFGSDVNLTEKPRGTGAEKEKDSAAAAVVPAPKDPRAPPTKSRACGFLGYWKADASDLEKTAEGPSARPTRLFAPVYCGLGAALSLCACFVFWLRMSARTHEKPQFSSGAVRACCSRSRFWMDTGPASRFLSPRRFCSASRWYVDASVPVRAPLRMHVELTTLLSVSGSSSRS